MTTTRSSAPVVSPASAPTPRTNLSLLESYDVAFVTFDRHLHCTFVSRAARRCLGDDLPTYPRSGIAAYPLLTRLACLIERGRPLGTGHAPNNTPYYLPLTATLAASVRYPTLPDSEANIFAVFHPVADQSRGDLSLQLGLTRREGDVAHLAAEGRSTKEIARLLDISVHTVRHHTENVFSKLGVHTRSELARLFAMS
jgi:DNA-binding CsgD family transcriptional regulator